MNYQFSYLYFSLSYFIVFFILFITHKPLQKRMLIMFLIFGLFGIIADPFYCIDYWRPITLTGNSVSLEPILLGGSFGGTASVIYQILFRKRSKVYETDTKKIKQN